MNIDISATKVLEGFIMYGILHGGVWLIMRILRPAGKVLKTERQRLLSLHVKSAHKGRFHNCSQCQTRQTGHQMEQLAVADLQS
jgi:hypothetical protein